VRALPSLSLSGFESEHLSKIILGGDISYEKYKRGVGIVKLLTCLPTRVVDPDPGGQIRPTNIEKSNSFHVSKGWRFSFEG
jgi:hypothetical protein